MIDSVLTAALAIIGIGFVVLYVFEPASKERESYKNLWKHMFLVVCILVAWMIYSQLNQVTVQYYNSTTANVPSCNAMTCVGIAETVNTIQSSFATGTPTSALAFFIGVLWIWIFAMALDLFIPIVKWLGSTVAHKKL